MRCSTSCQNSTSWAPTKFVASTPVRKMTSSVRIAPRPGMWTPSQCSVWADSGRSSSDASRVSKMTFSTHSVMISGIQMRSPVMRYFLSAPDRKYFFTARNEKARTQAGPLGSMRRSDGGLGFGFRFGLGVRLGFGLGIGLRVLLGVGGLLGAAALEVGGIPARAFQLETRRAQLLAVFGLAACGADGERRIGHLLQVLVLVAADRATVFVDRHGARLYR